MALLAVMGLVAAASAVMVLEGLDGLGMQSVSREPYTRLCALLCLSGGATALVGIAVTVARILSAPPL